MRSLPPRQPGSGSAVKRADLLVALRKSGIPDGSFWIEATHEPTPLPTEFLFLRWGGVRWETGVCERGNWDVVATFDTEAAACDHVLRYLA